MINNMKRLNKVIFVSLLAAIGLALSVIESSIPIPIAIPGARLGLSNMVILVSLVIFGFKEAFSISMLKSILLMLVTGSVSSFFYSITGAILSSIIMFLAYKYMSDIFSLIGISILGAAAHNVAQVGVASLILNNIRVFSYLPLLLLLSLFTGYFVGLSSIYISKGLKNNLRLFNK
jgi:uncharacterized membrane protein